MNAVLQQWLLSLAIDFPVELRLLPPLLDSDDRNPQALNVRSLRGFSLQSVVNYLVELAAQGLIEFIRDTEQGEPSVITPLEISPLASRPDIEKELSFKLTPAGGSAWETVAEPRWHDMDDGFASTRDENCKLVGFDWTLISQNRERLMAVLGWWSMLQEEHVNLETVAWEFIDDYAVKYWKHLPNVHVVRFQSLLRGPAIPNGGRGVEPRWFTAWRIARSTWYRRAWEMEDWPPTPDI